MADPNEREPVTIGEGVTEEDLQLLRNTEQFAKTNASDFDASLELFANHPEALEALPDVIAFLDQHGLESYPILRASALVLAKEVDYQLAFSDSFSQELTETAEFAELQDKLRDTSHPEEIDKTRLRIRLFWAWHGVRRLKAVA